MFATLPLLVCIVVAYLSALRSKRFRALKLSLVAVSIAMAAVWMFIDRISGNGIDDAALYHLWTGVQGAGIADFILPIAFMSTILLACAALPFLPWGKNQHPWRFAGSSYAVAMLAGIYFNPFVSDVASLLRQQRLNVQAPEFSHHYIKPQGSLGRSKNIVLLYAESLERTYLDDSRFPGLTPGLNGLRQSGVDFTDITSRSGGTWTMGGMVSSLCGVPLTLSPNANGYSSLSSFMPGARCLSDHLRDMGYELEFHGGATADFAGKGNFLSTHGFSTIRDKAFYETLSLGSNRFSSWGVHDDVLLDSMLDRFNELSSKKSPFALVGLTLDTHSPNGHIPFSCLDVDYRGLAAPRPMLNAVHCSDRLISKFVKSILEGPYAKNTLVVIASDHLAMANGASDLLQDAERRNLLMLFSNDLAATTNDRPATTLDTGATILDALHGGIALGFGRSQLAPKPLGTSLTTAPLDGAEDNLQAFIAHSRSLWNLGSTRDHLQLENGRLQLGKQQMTPPLMIVSDDTGEITTLGMAGVHSAAYTQTNGGDTLYIDSCFAFGSYDAADEWCLWGQLAGEARLVDQQALTRGAPIRELLENGKETLPSEALHTDFIVQRSFDSATTVVGQVTDGKLFSTYSAGILAFGPPQDLCAGSYELIVEGHAAPSAGAWVDMVSEAGERQYERIPVPDNEEGSPLLKTHYVFAENLKLGEVRVGVTPDTVLRLDGYTLLPSFETIRPGQHIEFNVNGDGQRYIGCGWNAASASGRGLHSAQGSIRLSRPADENGSNLALDARLSSSAPQTLDVHVNGAPLPAQHLSAGTANYRIELPPVDTGTDTQPITLTLSNRGDDCQAPTGTRCEMELISLDVVSM